MASNNLPLLAAALSSVVALSAAQQPVPVKYTIVDPPANAKVATPQYRVTQGKGFTLVSIFAGRKPTGGYSVEIAGVDRREGTCTVRYRVEAPAADMMVTQALTYPATTVRISPACQDVKIDPPLPRSQTKQ